MEFALSKELRTLGVVEFVVFLIGAPSNFKCSCVDLTFYNIDFIGLIFSALEMSIYITLLVLFRRDVRVCNDSLITAVIVLAVITLTLKLLNKMLDWLIPKLLKSKMEHSDPEALQANAMGNMAKNAFEMMEKSEKYEKWLTLFQKARVFIFPLLLILVLCFVAWAIFSFATSVKLAIPEDFQASCVNNSSIPKVIMLGLPAGAIGLYVARIAVKVGFFWHMSRLNLAEVNLFSLGIKLSIANTVALIPFALTLGVLSFMLFVRLIKVWRGEELELYEFVGLIVCTPLLRVNSEDSDETTNS